MKDRNFEGFYYTNSFYAEGRSRGFTLEPATAAVLLILGGGAWLSWRELRGDARAKPKGSSRCEAECMSAMQGGLRVAGLAAFTCLAALYTDLLSGFLHIVLDNPHFTTWPFIGPGAVGFQRHHHHPAGITVNAPLLVFVQEAYPGLSMIAATGLVPTKYSAGSSLRTAWLRVFLASVMLMSAVMMACHRWSHTSRDALHPWIIAAQDSGIILDHNAHSVHHIDYNMNFCIFTGWGNPMVNLLTAHVLNEHSRIWLLVLIGWAMTPLLVGGALRVLLPPSCQHQQSRAGDDEHKDGALSTALLREA